MVERRVCAGCGDAGVRMERHHILGIAFVPDVWVWVCAWPARNNCHAYLTRLQRDSGVVLDHNRERREAGTIWTFIAGWAAILNLRAQHHPDPDERANATLILRYAAALGLVVDETAVLSGEPAMSGPDPRGSDVRAAARNRKRTSRPDRAQEQPATADARDEVETFGVVLRALVDSVHSLVGSDDASRALVADLELFADNSATLFANLAELERRGRLHDTLAVIRDQLAETVTVLHAVPAALGDELLSQQLLPDVRRAGWRIDAASQLVGALCTTSDPNELEPALDRFLGRVTAGPPAGQEARWLAC
jgi:hypothetical protein